MRNRSYKVVNTLKSVVAVASAVATVVVMPMALAPAAASAATGPANCMSAPSAPEKSLPVIEVLTGTTAGDQSPSVHAVRAAALSKVVSAGFNMQARLLVDTIGAGPAGNDLAVNTQLQPTGPNQLFQQQNQKCKQKGATAAFQSLDHASSQGPIDVLGALQVAENNLTGLVGRKTAVDVVMLSSMLDASGPLALNTPTGLAQDPSSLISQVRSEGLMPNCHGWNVYIVGAGDEASGSLSDLQYQQLKTFWTDFFSACGGEVVLYDSQLTQFPVKPARQPPDHLTTKTRTDPSTHQREVVITLPTDVLFASGSATLLPGVKAVLTQLLPVVLHQYPTGSIQVTGYTDDVPIDIPGGNTTLSVERAQAVVTWLVKNGVPASRMHPIGLGSSDPVASNSTPAGQAANRRVVVSVVK